MKRAFLHFATALICVAGLDVTSCIAQEMTDEEILTAIREHPYRAAACHSPYYAPEVDYTPAPEGYTTFYISHLGRHGSRYQTDGSQVYDHIVSLLDSLHLAKALTPQGDSLRMELRHMQQIHRGMDGMLTQRGAAEHTGIARRLAMRCPTVFNQTDRRTVSCASTPKQRTIQSMAGFVAGLSSADPGLDFRISCGIETVHYALPEDLQDSGMDIDSLLFCQERRLSPGDAELQPIQTRLFKGYRASNADLFSLFQASASAGCLDIDVNPFRFFTMEELLAFYRQYDVRFSIKYGTFETTRAQMARKGKSFLRLMINEADQALEGNGHCADLRFVHDSNLGPVMSLLGIGGYALAASQDAPYLSWQSFNQICMASNLQLEFYRNADSDVLVKALFNEKEVSFPSLDAINGIYYRWPEVRRYMMARCEQVQEVPEYYVSYLQDKAAQIRKLQKDETDGFYFITDMHFPTNSGHSAALIEHLEHLASRRLIVYGGDALTYVNDIDEGMAMQISSLEQMRGASPILWARGNHDFVNYTGKKEWITTERKTLPAWESGKLLGMFRPLSAVSNTADSYTAYFYYDNPVTRVRYIVFDTSDTVQDDQKQDGLSDTQLHWIMGTAILGAPEGYGIVFISHRPFIGETGMDQAREALSAFSTHSACRLGEKTYDFALRKDLRMICTVCGHRHEDYAREFPGGQPQINVTADCDYDYMDRTKGSVDEQSFDYISISKDGHIRTVRIGKGEDRRF